MTAFSTQRYYAIIYILGILKNDHRFLLNYIYYMLQDTDLLISSALSFIRWMCHALLDVVVHL